MDRYHKLHHLRAHVSIDESVSTFVQDMPHHAIPALIQTKHCWRCFTGLPITRSWPKETPSGDSDNTFHCPWVGQSSWQNYAFCHRKLPNVQQFWWSRWWNRSSFWHKTLTSFWFVIKIRSPESQNMHWVVQWNHEICRTTPIICKKCSSNSERWHFGKNPCVRVEGSQSWRREKSQSWRKKKELWLLWGIATNIRRRGMNDLLIYHLNHKSSYKLRYNVSFDSFLWYTGNCREIDRIIIIGLTTTPSNIIAIVIIIPKFSPDVASPTLEPANFSLLSSFFNLSRWPEQWSWITTAARYSWHVGSV